MFTLYKCGNSWRKLSSWNTWFTSRCSRTSRKVTTRLAVTKIAFLKRNALTCCHIPIPIQSWKICLPLVLKERQHNSESYYISDWVTVQFWWCRWTGIRSHYQLESMKSRGKWLKKPIKLIFGNQILLWCFKFKYLMWKSLLSFLIQKIVLLLSATSFTFSF